jgi:TRAP-type C4-dicarboxylate transport system permease small subunit
MSNFLKKFGKDFELYIGSIFLCATTIIVIMNVFTRYFLKFTFHWSEEIAVSAFVWTIFLGFASAYKSKDLIGVELVLKMLPEKGRKVMEFLTSLLLAALSGAMFYFSYKYVAGSTKITAALEISYKYINASLIIAFALTTVYSIYFSVQSFKKIFSNENAENQGGDNKC